MKAAGFKTKLDVALKRYGVFPENPDVEIPANAAETVLEETGDGEFKVTAVHLGLVGEQIDRGDRFIWKITAPKELGSEEMIEIPYLSVNCCAMQFALQAERLLNIPTRKRYDMTPEEWAEFKREWHAVRERNKEAKLSQVAQAAQAKAEQAGTRSRRSRRSGQESEELVEAVEAEANS